MPEYDAAKQVIESWLDSYEWKLREIRDELRDMKDDPECAEFVPEVRAERRETAKVVSVLKRILDELDDEVQGILQLQAMEAQYDRY